MKKRMLLAVLMLVVVGMFGCAGKEPSVTEQVPAAEDTIAEEVTEEVAEEVPEEVAAEEEMPLPAEVQEQAYARETVEEEVVLETDPAVFEEVSAELTTYPVIKYTIMGEQKQIDYTMYESMYSYSMVSNAEFAIGYSTGDVTGDGLDDLIVSIYAVGNTLAESLQDTYVYSVDADINDLNEILYVSSFGGEQFAPGYPNNVGAVATGNGTLRLDLCAQKGNDGQFPEMSSVELVYQDGMWSVK